VNKFCPASYYDEGQPIWTYPYCRDSSAATRHTALDPTIWIDPPENTGIPDDPGHTEPYNPDSVYDADVSEYDADDFARDMADFVGCAANYGDAAEWCKDSLNYIDDEGGQGAVIYAIGLGELVLNFTQGGDADSGDRLLRYIANVGIDGDPNPDPEEGEGNTDPCFGVAVPALTDDGNESYNCGNYYFAEFGTGLASVFESIASRIFTRLTQ
jgi:hypothetical protein